MHHLAARRLLRGYPTRRAICLPHATEVHRVKALRLGSSGDGTACLRHRILVPAAIAVPHMIGTRRGSRDEQTEAQPTSDLPATPIAPIARLTGRSRDRVSEMATRMIEGAPAIADPAKAAASSADRRRAMSGPEPARKPTVARLIVRRQASATATTGAIEASLIEGRGPAAIGRMIRDPAAQ